MLLPRFFGFCAVCAALSSPYACAQTTPATPPAASRTEQQRESLVLRWIKPSDFVRRLAEVTDADGKQTILAGFGRVAPDDARRRVVLQGTPRVMKNLHELVQLLDVEPKHAAFTLRVLRFPADKMVIYNPDDLPEQRVLRGGEVVTTATAKTDNNVPVVVYAIGDGRLFHITVTPHINGDDTVTTSMELVEGSQVAANAAADKNAHTEARRAPKGERVIATKYPVFDGKNSKYYLEVTPVVRPRLSDAPQTAQIAPKTVQGVPQAR